jgi:hypothetical protein
MEGIKDEAFREEIMAEAEAMMGRAREKCAEVLAILSER